MASVDVPSETIARILYAAFLIMGVILLLNMLIALLSNTYQRTENNSFKVWSIKRAIAIQRYDTCDPVPVPLNIVYDISKLLIRLVGRKDKKQRNRLKSFKKRLEKECLGHLVIDILEKKYFAKHANLFPVTDEDKVDRVLHETDKNRQMVSQVLCTTFTSQGGDQGVLCVGQEMWKVHPDIRIEGLLLNCKNGESDDEVCPGARYLKHFSAEFPHFEVVILETGEKRWLGIGVVNEGYETSKMPGWESGSVGYHIDDGIVFHDNNEKETKGPAMARRGDRIRCTVMFGNEKLKDGIVQVPVMFSLNGRKIVTKEGEDQVFMDYDKPLYPYIGMTDGCSVLAKMCPREVEDLDSKVTKSLENTNRKLYTLLEELAKNVEKNRESLEETKNKLDALSARLTDSKEDQQNAKQC